MRSLNWFERWMLKGILRKIVSKHHLTSLFFEILVECRRRFYEDNDPTLLGHIDDAYERGKRFYIARQAAELKNILDKL